MSKKPSQNPKKKRLKDIIARIFRNPFKSSSGYSLEDSVSQILEHGIDDAHEEERNILKNIIDFGDLEASDVMINRTEIIAAQSNMKFSAIKKLFIDESHSRLPIYKSSLDDIEGFLHVKDVFKSSMQTSQDKFKISSLMRNIIFVPETIKLTELLSKMKSQKIHIAIVLDEYSGTSGLVTIEDIVEELIGDIQDEHDKNEDITLIHKEADVFLIDASAKIKDVELALDCRLVKKEDLEYETIGGFIITQLGCIPKVGTKLKLPNHWEFEVLDASARRVKKLKAVMVY